MTLEQYKNVAYMWFNEMQKQGHLAAQEKESKAVTSGTQTDPVAGQEPLNSKQGVYTKTRGIIS